MKDKANKYLILGVMFLAIGIHFAYDGGRSGLMKSLRRSKTGA